ncbi:MAG: hypothetical protein HC873_09480 [Leptolyngbyaceae cyanobacterium SL_1_1]|nr:hypothetical protein [Leptolyngbyaceae cyanobacterium SL_1_1]
MLCLFQPAVEFEKVCGFSARVAGLGNEPLGDLEVMRGAEILLLGGFGVLFMQAGAVGWLANPLYFAALLLAFITRSLKAKIVVELCAVTALGIAIISLSQTNQFPLLADEGGVCRLSAIQPKPGHWLWMSAIGLLNIHALISLFRNSEQPRA